MAMTNCPECQGDMSNYALSCPHCGKMNPAAPQAILLQDKRDSLCSESLKVREMYSSVMPKQTIVEDVFTYHSLWFGIRWMEELCEEWKDLKPVKKSVLQVLFGFAFAVGVLLLVYALFM